MNCWIWIILLWCFCGNNGCGNRCMCDHDCDRDNDCDHNSNSRRSVFSDCPNCGCDDDRRQPRGFVGFGDSATCGCEEKNS